jgi:hypothetical protein
LITRAPRDLLFSVAVKPRFIAIDSGHDFSYGSRRSTIEGCRPRAVLLKNAGLAKYRRA